MSHHFTSGDIREVELQEAPIMVRQNCILFYNMSSISSQQESEIIAVATQVAKTLNL
ncbi:hypothetical protein [Photobacterium sanguinicancri]|uniref:hypothetical protein n=1 Tax=Photobacterium sanguinicancri TaxID=875932 RepID=UPI0026E1416D|nr:hypothetical protein [Photobacterium sanguinicancri]MDO6496558.1 hypothetical protein [Photobacterium sanguinicancri]